MAPPDTKQRLLDAAEKLFARDGFHTTSLRAITGEARANLAAVNYHFGSKEALLEAVLERRLIPLNRMRRRMLDEAGRQPGQARAILRAFILPTIEFRNSGEGADNFVRLISHILAEPDEALHSLFVRQMGETFLAFFEALCGALPELSRNTVFWRLHFALGAMAHTLCWSDRLPMLPQGVSADGTGALLTDRLLDFVCAGMEAP